ncbi:phospholipase, patatin family protein [Elsinoe ampelina]|uniref:Phospholipase, patatin family protein n=1 Tax=Elsinoe ampelina TaxID=302913 RepID=A0A6A6GHW8_9PEZI|nr:phospholipase, patatin family protein [Elsinoe ampelina]
MSGRNLNLLCIDGGGIRGLSALYILQKLMELIQPDDPPKPCDCFDLIGGTSTGGWIAIMLGRLRMSADECITAFMDLQDEIFTKSSTGSKNNASNVDSPMYDMSTLEKGFKKIIASRGLDAESLLKDTDKPSCKVFVTATTAVGPSTEILSSYFRPRGPSELYKHTKIWEAARATSATGSFFGPIEIGPQKRKFYDGSALTTNPVEKIWEEAAEMVEDTDLLRDKVNCLVSIGTGLRSLTSFDDSAEGLLQTLMSIATDAETTADRFQRDKSELFQNKSCYRFSAPSVGNIDLNTPEVKGDVAQMTDHYIRKEDTWNLLRQCKSKLSPRVGM